MLVVQATGQDTDLAVTVPPASWIQARMVETAGGTPVWVAENRTTGWLKVGIEQVAAWDPEHVLVGLLRVERRRGGERLAGSPAWQATRAGRAGAIRAFPADLVSWDQSDTRWILGLEWLAATLHPERFPGFDLRAEATAFYRELYGVAPATIESLILPRLAHGDRRPVARCGASRRPPARPGSSSRSRPSWSPRRSRADTPRPASPRRPPSRSDPLALRLLLGVRLPRIAAGILLGASLAAAGTVFQMLFANPLVEPGFLGVSRRVPPSEPPSASWPSTRARPACRPWRSLAAWPASRARTSWPASFRYGGWVLRLVLAGIAVSALLSAGVGALKLAADPLGELPELTFWLLGGLWRASWRDVLAVLPAIAAGLGVTLALRGRLDVLSLDDRVAHSLGAAPSRERLLLLLAATLATAAAVSVSGLVGWIGLMAPHAARRLFGASSRRALPAAVLLGAASVLACDTVARTLLPAEIPLGIVTAIAGAGVLPRPDDERPAGARGMSAGATGGSAPPSSRPAASRSPSRAAAACSAASRSPPPPGTVTAVLGPNGSGKTTLLDVCLGWRRPDRGTVLLARAAARVVGPAASRRGR